MIYYQLIEVSRTKKLIEEDENKEWESERERETKSFRSRTNYTVIDDLYEAWMTTEWLWPPKLILLQSNDNKWNRFKYASLIRLVIKCRRTGQKALLGLCETVSPWFQRSITTFYKMQTNKE